MSQEETEKRIDSEELHERPPEFDFEPQFDGRYRSPVLMRVMIVIVNIAALIFCRSFIQSWYSVHGKTPIWIPIAFLIVPLGSLFFIYYYMGRIGREIITKLICLACCALQVINFIYPVNPSQIFLGKEGYTYDYSYVAEVEKNIGIKFPECVTATTVDGVLADEENKSIFSSLKSFFMGEKLLYCTDVIYSADKAKEFESFIKQNPIWLDEIPKEIRKLAISTFKTENYDCFLFFDCDSKAFNSLPQSDRHTIYQVMYNSQSHEMRILKYIKNF